MSGLHLDLPPRLTAALFGADWQARLAPLGLPPVPDPTGADVLITGWGSAPLDAARLSALPHLALVAHAAGTVKTLVSDALWARGIRMVSAAAANAVPVAEYTVAAIVMANKNAFGFDHAYRRTRRWPSTRRADIGNRGRTVGLIGASIIGRLVMRALRGFEFEVLLHDPYVDAAEAHGLGARLVPLDALLAASHVVSLHAPLLPATRHMLGAAEFARMRDGATFINTARGGIVDSQALTAELVAGRLRAVIDTSDPEPLPEDSPLFDLDNVFLTPHIAGSLGNEITRMGDLVVAEIQRWRAGAALHHEVHRDRLDITA